jgi:uncharacterized protein YuzE
MEKKQCSLQRIGISVQRSSPRDIEAIYLKISDGKVVKSKEIGPNGEAVVDIGEKGEVVGIEMLAPGIVGVRTFNKIRKDYKIKDLENINMSKLQEAFT